ncbi:glycosyltransferase [Pseudohalocynthiibacter aestuariivivens]|uniref:Glycosyltransferase n=1 Tax=Pseudohalocynthiibacter aestuariivivens TaxID=1591409 RepID=A0ABV5JIN8_9RHOB|nr:glycosyltransferase [Pseudohalocynthiibacter aestuariivivens]MBS9715315.1 glycosyltransferase [Pseudohalocynthiibacter aestuariivivens]
MVATKLKKSLHAARKTIFSALVNHLHKRKEMIPFKSDLVGAKGFLEVVKVCNNRIQIEGWANTKTLRFRCAGLQKIVTPDLHRGDLKDIPEHRNFQAAGFTVDIPFGPELEVQYFSAGRWKDVAQLSTIGRPDWLRAIFHLALILLRIGVTRPRALIQYFLFGDRLAAGELERMLIPQTSKPAPARLSADLFMAVSHDPKASAEIAVIVPVFNAFELLQNCLDRVVLHSDMAFELIVVEDASTDPRVKPWLRDWCAKHSPKVKLIENSQNLGFIASVNRALEETTNRHAVLLNSDAFVPAGWLSRLIKPILDDHQVASVTPMSNNATIMSVPVINGTLQLNASEVDSIDAIAKQLNPQVTTKKIPTGVGFCMAINARHLRRIPTLDTVFGKGYGEEVDWCLRASKIGGINVGIGNLFVEHRSGQSFSPETKAHLLTNNGQIISQRFPLFNTEVQDFIAEDSLISARIALAIATLNGDGEVPIFLAHTLGGGAEIYLTNRIAALNERGKGAIILRKSGSENSYALEVHTCVGMLACQMDDLHQLEALLSCLDKRLFIYSCVVGAKDPMDFVEFVFSLMDPTSDNAHVLLHDFFPVCPSYNLLNYKNEFCGVPSQKFCQKCFPSLTLGHHLASENLKDWRERWESLFKQVERIEAFSESSKEIFSRAYPEFRNKVKVNPHELPVRPNTVSNLSPPETVIAVLGNIGFGKGADVVRRMAQNISDRRIKVIVIGTIDPTYSHPDVSVLGPYKISELTAIAKDNKVSCWLIPSICPETFSFTTHEALATGLPVFCFDFGAQAEAVYKAKNGIVLRSNPENSADSLEEILDYFTTGTTQHQSEVLVC